MTETPHQIRAKIEERFVRVACSPHEKPPFLIGPESAKRLGSPAAEIDALPPSVTESFAGVGNPFGLGEFIPGPTVLDLGSGAGMDSILAARRIGPSGEVVGVDVTTSSFTQGGVVTARRPGRGP